jgi:hypothetical protein
MKIIPRVVCAKATLVAETAGAVDNALPSSTTIVPATALVSAAETPDIAVAAPTIGVIEY